VRDLSAARVGGTVELKFTLPQRTTDNLPIREAGVKATLCRGGESQPCLPVPTLQNVTLGVSIGASLAERTVTWRDELPTTEASGEPRLLLYRVELSNLEGKTAGWSDPAYAAAGAAPAAVTGLRAEETRAGVLLAWQPGGSKEEVLLRRERVSPPPGANPAETEPVWLESHANGPTADETIDPSASEDTPYRYVAARRKVVETGGHKVELRSALSAPVEITWKNAFPPPAPVGLSAAPYSEGGAFAVDLVWEPVQEPGLKGYLVTRQALDADGTTFGNPEKLTPQPVDLPAFHDATAKQGVRYQYSVQAVSAKGVEGKVATVVAGP